MTGGFTAAFKALNPRERLTIISGAALLGAVVFYLYAWEPMRKESATIREELSGTRRTSEWMRLKKSEAERLVLAVNTALKAGEDVEAFTKKAFEGSGAENLAVKTLAKDKVSVMAGAIEPKKLFTIIGKLRKEGLITASAMKIEALPDGKNVMAEGVFVRMKGDGR
jgi:type II secretory pathway component PulM